MMGISVTEIIQTFPNWITGGDTAALLSALEGLAIRGWRVGIDKYEPVRFIPWP